MNYRLNYRIYSNYSRQRNKEPNYVSQLNKKIGEISKQLDEHDKILDEMKNNCKELEEKVT